MKSEFKTFFLPLVIFSFLGISGQSKEDTDPLLQKSKRDLENVGRKIDALPIAQKSSAHGRYLRTKRLCERGEDYVTRYNNFKGGISILNQCIRELNDIDSTYSLGVLAAAQNRPAEESKKQTQPDESKNQNVKPEPKTDTPKTSACPADQISYQFSKRTRCAFIGNTMMNFKSAEAFCKSKNMGLLDPIWMGNKGVLSEIGSAQKNKSWTFKDQYLWLNTYRNKYYLAKSSDIADMFSYKITENAEPTMLAYPVCDDTRGI
ncbi:hypothetical protein EHQ13_06325 [Leptospira gomenensis]|uniref:C-type lectin domain-containing protein n=2 Tax=Leptospira gomenensis TaxID=2484974 RepID=A0A5F1YDA6_9LEPT|nr:hypothetical protein [Leptospira gomenensis]TGK36060.1 hypothetical protein EHQ17_05650 [Leptospira gomenensis]TGK53337.1 hypothetical protein EHQ07_00080 [Leptospira gomenensis]TGK64943.1 hypothetical protein EHQ13_06325 [Leptospira gomenensis]